MSLQTGGFATGNATLGIPVNFLSCGRMQTRTASIMMQMRFCRTGESRL